MHNQFYLLTYLVRETVCVLVSDADPLVLSFRVKYYPSDPERLHEELTRSVCGVVWCGVVWCGVDGVVWCGVDCVDTVILACCFTAQKCVGYRLDLCPVTTSVS